MAAGFLGSLGLGGGTLLMLWMSFFEPYTQVSLAGVNLLFFLGSGLGPSGVYVQKRLIDLRRLCWTLAGGLPGVLAGYFLGGAVEEALLRKAFAVLLLIVGLRELLRRDPLPKYASGRKQKR